MLKNFLNQPGNRWHSAGQLLTAAATYQLVRKIDIFSFGYHEIIVFATLGLVIPGSAAAGWLLTDMLLKQVSGRR